MIKQTYCDPELQYQIEQIIAGKMSFKDKDYQKILRALWKEYVNQCKEDSEIIKKRDKAIELLNSW